MKEALAKVWYFKIGGRITNNVKFADCTAIIARTLEETEDMVSRLADTGRKYCKEIKHKKS